VLAAKDGTIIVLRTVLPKTIDNRDCKISLAKFGRNADQGGCHHCVIPCSQ
jgi:hypothetical protein